MLTFFGTPLVIAPSPDQLSGDAGLLPIRQFDQRRRAVWPLGSASLPRRNGTFFDFLPPREGEGMVGALAVGDRVRVTVYGRVAGYQPGDKGTVLGASVSAATGDRYYTVAMDKNSPDATGVIFAEGEIEADV
jgi:hypothetical protein